jgi:hypothetical protein
MACLDAHLYEIEYTRKEQLNSRESSHLNKLTKAHKVFHKLILINYFIIGTYKVREKKCDQ